MAADIADKSRDSLPRSLWADAYEIVRPLGEGGMAEVYEAVQLRLKRRVAIKVMAHALAGDAEAMARFRREAEITSAMGHPHIVQVFDIGTAPTGAPFLAMELLEGEDLEHRLLRRERLAAPAVLAIVKQVASALAAAHQKGIVHRDLKPANVFLVAMADGSDFAKVLDFGVSKARDGTTKLTGAARLLGTPRYMSPEQAQGLGPAIDETTDQWALACIVWEALSGRPPFVADDDLSVLFKVVYEEPPPLVLAESLRAKVEPVLRRALRKHKPERFSSVLDFALALERAMSAAVVGPAWSAAPAGEAQSGGNPPPVRAPVVAHAGAASGKGPARLDLRWKRLTLVGLGFSFLVAIPLSRPAAERGPARPPTVAAPAPPPLPASVPPTLPQPAPAPPPPPAVLELPKPEVDPTLAETAPEAKSLDVKAPPARRERRRSPPTVRAPGREVEAPVQDPPRPESVLIREL